MTLTIADVARLRGVTRQAAWEWLTRNSQRDLRKRGRMWTISTDAYKRVATGARVKDETSQLRSRLDAMEDTLSDLVRCVELHGLQLTEVRHLVKL